MPPTAFVNFLQNHDQIGNRALGDRLESIADPEAIEAALAITLLAPMIPMLFMGEEWGSKAPFPFFCDFEGDLADAVRKGRRREYAWAYAKYGDEVPDPLDRSDLSIRRARLGRARRAGGTQAAGAGAGPARDTPARDRRRGWRARAFGEAHAADNGLLTANWRMGDGATLRLLANLSDQRDCRARADDDAAPRSGAASAGDAMPPWSVFWRIGGALMPPAIPIATYRAAAHGEFRFRRGRGHRALSEGARHQHLYASPFMKARKGSTHGYDIVDHTSSIRNSAARPASSD